ncbi:hypothetical protein Ct9H90mP29_13080 [bacterium]|nr:MAG: hypothetical protein Ct9H90mP29_13080 [bacterium]
MTLSKKDRTKVTQKMRAYYSDMVKKPKFTALSNYLMTREKGSPKNINDPSPKHKGDGTSISILHL